ncbi:uroporphyrinogen-III synthase [Rhodoblastus acidophilus]|jgi:uroporphyrinogen-III synthase|uniref:Uroporphyrinogen-III synthase n=1 Tax=Rhodoblastus acidophilus TaxID=1074 RepID=A0A6N8DK87_RHOAC|nr:uroporphyrinogen-III synthase [Rhodoblastus acidophilus]MCW2274233.1 uroporphyrinogen-III synthase [Rhodoblastus acidophilus]MTV30797.1 uroporphyrinogen-III synthase [Rhodoblastus acidophilus]
MRLLVTRPVDEAERTAGRLSALGHEALIAPVMEVAPTGAALPDGPFDLVVATSARALHEVAPIAAPLACVGEKTAAAGRKAGFSVAAVAPDAERLADLLLKESGTKRVLYVAGRERRADLETRLGGAGWRVDLVEVYAARPVAAWPKKIVEALAAGEIDGVLHYSPRSAALALPLMGEARTRLDHFCLSPAVARACAEIPADRVFVASQPIEDCLLSLIERR